MGTYRQPSLVLDKSFGQINEAMAEFNKNLIAKINADKKQALANEKAKNKLLREQEKANSSYREYGREIEKKLSVLKPFFEDDAISINTGVGAITRSVEEFEADLVAYQGGKTSAELGYGDNFDIQAYYDNILDGNLQPIINHPKISSVGFLNKRHFNLSDVEVDAILKEEKPVQRIEIRKGIFNRFSTFKYSDFN